MVNPTIPPMIKENYFSKKMTNKDVDELFLYVDKFEEFQEEAVLAAIWELEKRGIMNDKTSQVHECIAKIEKRKHQQTQNPRSSLFAPLVISIFIIAVLVISVVYTRNM